MNAFRLNEVARNSKRRPELRVCIICAKPIPAEDEDWMSQLDSNGEVIARFKVHRQCKERRKYV